MFWTWSQPCFVPVPKTIKLKMKKEESRGFSWDFYSGIIVAVYALFQVLRWGLLPQFMDIYYHIQTAWGFLQAGGYSGWDFWQYAPYGRLHIYPPFFHIVLAFFIKLGVDKIILAKLCEVAIPVVFFVVLRNFTRRNFSSSFAFFSLIALNASFSFYNSLTNHLPATLTAIFGLLAFDGILKKQSIRPLLWLVLGFYTHIGMSWFWIMAVLLYGLINKEYRRLGITIFISSLVLSGPILFKQLVGLRVISISGIYERYFCEFKTVEYLFAFLGLWLVLIREKKFLFFLSLFMASFIFLPYPYRFFSAQGYLPVGLLAAVSLDYLYKEAKGRAIFKYLCLFGALYMFVLSATVQMQLSEKDKKIRFKSYLADSAFTNMLFPLKEKRTASISLWFPKDYLPIREIIKINSDEKDIVSSSLSYVGVCLASISGRACANGLFPEITPLKRFEPFAVSKIAVTAIDENPSWLAKVTKRYKLNKVGETEMFDVYRNSACSVKMQVRKASVAFGWIILLMGIWLALFLKAKKIEGILKK